jgi:hypothetical protein
LQEEQAQFPLHLRQLQIYFNKAATAKAGNIASKKWTLPATIPKVYEEGVIKVIRDKRPDNSAMIINPIAIALHIRPPVDCVILVYV